MTRSIYSPRRVLFGALAAFLGLASAHPGAAQTSQAAGAPDLTPNIEAILQGAVSIRNLGAPPAGASLATVRCVGFGDNPCAQSPLMTRFTNPNIPDVISVVIPPLGPGDAYDYKLPYWNALDLSLIHISEPTRRTPISYAVF